MWRRYAKLHTQLLPYIEAADAEYRRPECRSCGTALLTDPGDPRAGRADDQFEFGPDLLAAPVLSRARAGARSICRAGAGWTSGALRLLPEPDGGLRLAAPAAARGRDASRCRRRVDELPLLRARRRRAAAAARRRGHARALCAARGGATGRPARPDAAARVPARALRVAAWGRGASGSCPPRVTARWTLTVRGKRARTYRLQASLRTLRRPFAPRACCCTAGHWRAARGATTAGAASCAWPSAAAPPG